MKNVLSGLGVIALTAVVFLGGAATMHFYPEVFGIEREKDINDVKDEPEETSGLDMPGETTKTVVTIEDIEVKLDELSEFSTYSGTYSVTLGKDETRYWLEKMEIPFTTNSIEISCKGIVKVGYDFSKITVRIDDDKIYISLPEPKINDNYVIWDTVECKESNNILNPISFTQYHNMIDEIEEKGVEYVESEDIYKKAEDNIKTLINGFMSEFSDYEIVYM